MSGQERLPVSGPWITDLEVAYVADAARNAWYENANTFQNRFESRFAEYLGVEHAVSLPSCTSAIHLALAALGIGPGDEVIVPDVTWIATAAPVSYVGATTVFADIDPHTWCLSVDSFTECLSERTKAVIPVDLYGNVPDMAELCRKAAERGIAVIEDAAEAIGSEYKGKKAGAFGGAGVFSFHGSKTLTTGEGGMLVTNNGELIRTVQILRDHGRLPGDPSFWNDRVGFKYKMSALQAALGLAQLERVEELVARKRQIYQWYADRLAGLEGITLNYETPSTKNSYWMVTIILDPRFGLTKGELIAALGAAQIDSRPFFHPLSSLPAYAGSEQAERARQRNTVSYRLSPYGVNLPSGLSMTYERVERVCWALRSALGLK